MKYLNQFIAKVKYELFINDNEFNGCTEAEIEQFKTLVAKKGFELPAAYIEFLKCGGHGIGSLFKNCYQSYEHNINKFKLTQQRLSEGKKVFHYEDTSFPKNGFQFLEDRSRGGFFWMDGTPNPRVYDAFKDDQGFYDKRMTFSDYLLKTVDLHLVINSSIPLRTQQLISGIQKEVTDIKILITNYNTAEKEDINYRLERFADYIWNLNRYGNTKENLEKLEEFLPYYIEKIAKASIHIKDTAIQYEISEKVSFMLEYLSFKPTEETEHSLKHFKQRIDEYLATNSTTKKDYLSPDDYLDSWADLEVNIGHKDKAIRAKATWFRPQLLHYYFLALDGKTVEIWKKERFNISID